jgi:translocator protein
MVWRDVLRLVVAVGVSLSAGAIGSLAVGNGGGGAWYAALEKPWFTPAGWVFGLAWTVLYVLMGVAAFLVWRRGLERRTVRVALGWFVGQLVLNGLWTPVFFGWQRVGPALGVIVVLWGAIVATMVWFWRVSRAAAGLLGPYLAWVSFAAVLNASIWWLNR